jgi:hypothetical protein
MSTKKADPYVWLALLLSLPVAGPLLQPGYFWGAHDARHSVYFLHQFNKVIQDGIWYPRWAPDFAFGYGYPFFNIYGPLSSYLGEGLLLAGLDIVTAVKVVFGLAAILSGLSMYLFVRRLLGPPAGLIAALTYVYLPYHVFDLYVRAALAESVGFVFVPLALWGFYEVVTRPRLAALLWTALAYAALMFTSNLLALMFTPILGLYVATMLLWYFIETAKKPHPEAAPQPAPSPNSRPASDMLPTPHVPSIPHPTSHIPYPLSRLFHIFLHHGLPSALALALGLGLSAIFWLPGFVEYPYVRVDQWIGGRFAFGDDFVELFQLFSPRWGFGASIPGPDDDTSFQVGLAATVLFSLSFLVVPRLTDPLRRRTLSFFQALALLMLFLTIPISGPVWTLLPLSSLAQFPWRLLVIIAPLVSIVAGSIMAGQSEPIGQDEPAEIEAIDKTDDTAKPKTTTAGPQQGLPISLSTIILATLILLATFPYLRAEVRDPKPTEGPVSLAALFRFQQSADEMTGQTAWVRRIPNWSSLAEQVEGGGQITTKVNYSALPPDDSLGVFSMELDSRREFLWVGTQLDDQTVTHLPDSLLSRLAGLHLRGPGAPRWQPRSERGANHAYRTHCRPARNSDHAA